MLAEAICAQHFSVGDEIRKRRAAGEKLVFDRKTGLLSTEATRELLAVLLASKDPCVIDGLPRTPEQVPLLVDLGISCATVIALEVDFPTAMTRMRGRGREGEDPGVIAMRHSDHQRRSPGLLDACRDVNWRVAVVDGSHPIEQVAKDVIGAFNGAHEEGG